MGNVDMNERIVLIVKSTLPSLVQDLVHTLRICAYMLR